MGLPSGQPSRGCWGCEWSPGPGRRGKLVPAARGSRPPPAWILCIRHLAIQTFNLIVKSKGKRNYVLDRKDEHRSSWILAIILKLSYLSVIVSSSEKRRPQSYCWLIHSISLEHCLSEITQLMVVVTVTSSNVF